MSLKGIIRVTIMFVMIPLLIFGLEWFGALIVIDTYMYLRHHDGNGVSRQFFNYAFNACIGYLCYRGGDRLIVYWLTLWGRLKENLHRSRK